MDKKKAVSKDNTIIKDLDNNIIYLENFEFLDENIFKSVGLVKIEDKQNNTYEFSQVYIDTKKEILGTDIKAFINDERLKVSTLNKLVYLLIQLKSIDDIYNKSIFTMCNYREKDNAHHGVYSHQKYFDNQKKQFIMITLCKNL